MGGDMKFVDSFFSFLRRRTMLLNKKESVAMVQDLALKHVAAAEKDLALRRKKITTKQITALIFRSTHLNSEYSMHSVIITF